MGFGPTAPNSAANQKDKSKEHHVIMRHLLFDCSLKHSVLRTQIAPEGNRPPYITQNSLLPDKRDKRKVCTAPVAL